VDSRHRREGEDAQSERRHRGGADLGPVISKQAKDRIESLIAQSEKEGAKVELDGRNPQIPNYPKGNFIAPTVISGVKPSHKTYQTEIFGPCSRS
jgi:malonate-semialdehyde dehydrogenase (acetylating)/methylmalonate-semialdehyde dehydrogenase